MRSYTSPLRATNGHPSTLWSGLLHAWSLMSWCLWMENSHSKEF